MAAPSKQAKSLGWIYFTVAPGDFDLEVSTWRFEDVYNKYDAAILTKHYRLHVGQEAKVIYGGSFFTKCKDSILPNCDEAAPPIDESLAAEAIVKSNMANSGPFVTELLQPYTAEFTGTVSDLQPIGLVIQRQDKFVSPPWTSRGMSRFTGLGDPGKPSSPPPDLSGLVQCGQACALPIMLYTMYLPVGAIIGAGYGKYTEAKWKPCINSLQKELTQFDFSAKLNEAIDKAFSAKNLSFPVALNHAEPIEEAARLGIKTLINTNIQRIQLRECDLNGTFCIEMVLHFNITDIKSRQVLFGKTFLYSQSVAGSQERPYEIRIQESPTCHPMASYCNSDRKVFFDQLMKGINALASEVLQSLKSQ
ncbi:hypothetical protein [Methylomicrobium sp. Wu6]|uniref:hypothetical protein n=1 Tax=Methylomicrobium sp. Wu6 TaxID=3107928 RepID=UPI002DD67A07|nr:hypothetical protein [Methylomicrobium sp. Wu6]MEC4748862.1 hypothetical protein [Methylomicrobium sp. Wu6]